MSWLSKNVSSIAAPETIGMKWVKDKITGQPKQVPANDNSSGPALDQYTNDTLPAQGQANQDMLMNEAELEKKMASDTASSNASARAKYLSDLTGILHSQQANDFNAAAPGIMDDLNSRGVFRSSGLGNAFARKEGELSAATSSKLAEQGLADNNANLAENSGIENAYLGNRSGAIARNLSVQDYANQIQGGKLLGKAVQPIAPTPSKSSTPLQGALGGASIGASAGGGPWGAAIGGAAGLAAGKGK